MCQNYIAATAIFPLWFAVSYLKFSNRMTLPLFEAVKSKQPCGQNHQLGTECQQFLPIFGKNLSGDSFAKHLFAGEKI